MEKNLDSVHKFERAGLGKAPFRFIGMYEDRGPHKFAGPGGTTIEIGSPGQPMGVCKYCGTGIAICCKVRSADGNEFVVGSDCIAKVGDEGMVKTIKRSPEYRAHQRRLREDLDIRKTQELRKLLAENEAALTAIPHKWTSWQGVEQVSNKFESITRAVNISGAAGRAKYLKYVKELLK